MKKSSLLIALFLFSSLFQLAAQEGFITVGPKNQPIEQKFSVGLALGWPSSFTFSFYDFELGLSSFYLGGLSAFLDAKIVGGDIPIKGSNNLKWSVGLGFEGGFWKPFSGFASGDSFLGSVTNWNAYLRIPVEFSWIIPNFAKNRFQLLVKIGPSIGVAGSVYANPNLNATGFSFSGFGQAGFRYYF